MSVVLITGLSGSGKTTALRALEDIGYLCMDNLPVVLLPKVLELATPSTQRLAVGVDARDRQFIADAGPVIDALLETGVDVRVLYLDSQPQKLIQRFSETRRRHPLLFDTGDFRAAIDEERTLLDELRSRADVTIDTSEMTVHQLKRLVQERFSAGGARRLSIVVESFGFKHGPLTEADLVFDVRFMTNPYFVPHLRESTGLDPEVAAFVLAQDGANEFVERTADLLAFLIPRYEAEGKVYLTIGIGCTGGKHRSVAIAERLAAVLGDRGIKLQVDHRDRRFWAAQRSA